MACNVKINGMKIELEAKTLRLRKGDWEKLDAFYPKSGARTAIRLLVASHVDRLTKKAADSMGIDLSEVHDPLPSSEDSPNE